MQRHKATFKLAPGQAGEIKQRMLCWASRYSIFLFLDSNEYRSAPGHYECLLAASATDVITGNDGDLLGALQELHDNRRDWIFGHITYDYKNVLEPRLHSRHPAGMGYPLLHFFIPRTVCYIDREQTILTIASFDDPTGIYDAIMATQPSSEQPLPECSFTPMTTREAYLTTLSKLREHLTEGDCYEINYCNMAYCKDAAADPLQVFRALTRRSPAPFAAYYRLHDKYMMCASPERYLRKEGITLLAQPIKGTAPRDPDPTQDALLKAALQGDIKERAENVMIADLMRNDLARCCETGTVNADELFGIYTFPQVHQMISTISGTLRAGLPFTEAIRCSFPMGSMTGAPKFMIMELIERYECSMRELYSGTVGYITPGGDFDLNVVIRSLFYNATTRHLSYHTGGAITYDSDPLKEWEEMRLKAWALERIFRKEE